MHIHKEFNTLADQLSKKALDSPMGWFYYEEIFNENIVNKDTFKIF
jgi:hypothetical protein